MKILFVIYGMGAGGAERQASLLCNHWVLSGHQVVLATLHEDSSHYDLHSAIIRRIIRSNSSSSSLGGYWDDLGRIRELIAQERPDVVTAFMDVTNIKVLYAARRSGVPVIISERSIPSSVFTTYGPWFGLGVAAFRRLAYPLSSALVVQTEPVARWARSRRLSRQVAIIPNVIDSKGTAIEPRGRDSNIVLSVGRLSREKGHDILIRAFAKIAKAFPEWRLEIIGNGVSRPALSDLIKRLDLQDRAQLAPTRKIATEDYRSAGVFVLPSRFEGFPNALIEAMQAGCPVIAADCPVGPRHIVSDGLDGLLFRNEDVSDLASKLATLMRDGRLRATLGDRAREAVRKYQPEVVFPLWDRLLDVVVAERRVDASLVSGTRQK